MHPHTTCVQISVIIPTKNRAELLTEALNSVVAQTHAPEEIIVIDDGGTDDTHEKIQGQFADRVQVLRQDCAGPAAARNRGLSKARHPWIAFLDSDDLWEPQKLERQCEALKARPEAQIAICDSRPIDFEGKALEGHHKAMHEGQITRELFQHIFVHTPSVLASAQLLRELDGFDASLRVAEDYDLWLRASLKTPFALAPEKLFLRRVHSQSLAHEPNPHHHEDTCKVLERFAALPEAKELITPTVIKQRLARVHFRAARAWRNSGTPKLAVPHLQRVLKLTPWNLRARWMRMVTPS